MEKTHFSKKYLIVNEVLSAVTHSIGAGLSIAGLVTLFVKGAHLGPPIHMVSYAIYGSMLILLSLFSTLFHSLIFIRAKKVFQVFDYSSIFLLIIGSYTSFYLISIGGQLGWTLFSLVWLIIIIGIVYKSLTLYKQEIVKNISAIIYIVLGWLCIIAARPLYESLGFTGTALLIAGGVSYTLGAAFYSLRNVRFMHVVWHLLIMLATILTYFSVLFYT